MIGVAGSPPTRRDVDALPEPPGPSHWDRLMADPCPRCGAFRMDVGEYVHYGTCERCETAALTEFWAERDK